RAFVTPEQFPFCEREDQLRARRELPKRPPDGAMCNYLHKNISHKGTKEKHKDTNRFFFASFGFIFAPLRETHSTTPIPHQLFLLCQLITTSVAPISRHQVSNSSREM